MQRKKGWSKEDLHEYNRMKNRLRKLGLCCDDETISYLYLHKVFSHAPENDIKSLCKQLEEFGDDWNIYT